MAFKTFTVGEIATASDVNTYLMKQAVIVCTSGTRPSSPVEGMVIYETDTDNLKVWDGAAWQTIAGPAAWSTFATTWTAVTTNPTIGNGTITARYRQEGKTVHYAGRILMGSTTTYGTGTWIIDLPVTAVGSTLGVGAGQANDSSTVANRKPVVIRINTSTTMVFFGDTGNVDATNPFTWADTDALYWMFTYESA